MNSIVTLGSLLVAVATTVGGQSTTSAPQGMCASYVNRYTNADQCVYSFIVPKKDRDHCPGLEKQIELLETRLQKLEEKQNATGLRIADLYTNQDNQKKIGRLEAEVTSYLAKIAEQTADIDRLESEKLVLNERWTRLDINHQDAATELKIVQEKFTFLQQNHTALTADFTTVKTELDNLKETHRKLQNDYNNMAVNKNCSDVNKHLPSCAVLKEWGYTESGDAMIDPDGQGGVDPFLVYCDMDSDPSTGITVIKHNHEEDSDVSGCEIPGCFNRPILYNGVTIEQISKLADISIACEQYIRYKCFDSKLLKDGTGWWVSRNNTKMTYWGGASPGSNRCACGMTGTCEDRTEVCNCDADAEEWLQDEGTLHDKDSLPVTALRFGDVSIGANEKGKYHLGPLRCKWNVNMSVPSCAALRDAGVQRSGNFLVDPDGQGPIPAQLTHCNLDSGSNGTSVRPSGPKNPNLFVFNDCGQKPGRFGPTADQCSSTYGGSNVFVNITEGMQLWRVPRNGRYRVAAYAPNGLHARESLSGRGAVATAEFKFPGGTQLKILVGQKGVYNGGSGGTFVIMMKEKYTAVPFVVAGGGGSSTDISVAHYQSTDASTQANAKDASMTATGIGHGGKNGEGGERGNRQNGVNTPGGGAGFRTAGQPSTDDRFETPEAARAIKGSGSGVEAPGIGGIFIYQGTRYEGGFGGGGSGAKNEPGGAGGYSGGGGGSTGEHSGGGGSYVRTEDALSHEIVATNRGKGQVVIEYLGPAPELAA